MKKHPVKLLILIGGTLFFTTCKKENCTNRSQLPAKEGKGKNEIKQKIIIAEPEIIISKIKEFKNSFNKMQLLSKSTMSQTVPADSAIWLLETALNYDFDINAEGTNTSDSTGFLINAVNVDSVPDSELNNAYSAFYSYISQKITQNKSVKVIDLYAHKQKNYIVISGKIIFTETSAGNKTEGICDPYTNITARWSYPYTSTPPFMYCTNYPTNNDGPTLCNIKLNCYTYHPPCNPYFYTNVVTYLFDNMNNTYPNALFYYFSNSGAASVVCNPPLLTDVQLNTYINGCKILGISNIPSTPGYVITNYSVNATLQILPPAAPYSSGYSILWWYLNVTYAIPTCSGGTN